MSHVLGNPHLTRRQRLINWAKCWLPDASRLDNRNELAEGIADRALLSDKPVSTVMNLCLDVHHKLLLIEAAEAKKAGGA